MPLIRELKHQNIVIIANNFNPSIFNSYWLISNDFIKEDSILPNSTFLPVLTQVNTKDFKLLVTPEQLQFGLIDTRSPFEEHIKKSLLPMIKRLKEIPYRALGVNFTWFLSDSDKETKELGKDLFYFKDSKLHRNFNSDDSRFGSYLSKNFDNSRLKLEIKPIILAQNTHSKVEKLTKKIELIQFVFNFHVDLNNGLDELIETLENYKRYKEESKNIINLLL